MVENTTKTTNTAYSPIYERGTNPNFGKQSVKNMEMDMARAKCQADGGTWDEKTQTCIFKTGVSNSQITAVNNLPQQQKQGATQLNNPEVFKNPQTGQTSGIVLPNGTTFLGLSPDDVNKISADELKKTQVPEGTQMVGTAAAQAQEQANIQRLTNLAQQGLLTQQELQAISGANPNIAQALGAAGISSGIGLVGGAATGLGAGIGGAAIAGAVGGAAAGSAIPVAGTIAGAALGAVGGFLYAIRNDIKKQQTGEFAADQEALKKGQTFLRSLISDTNKNPQNAPENIALFYQTLNQIDAAHAKTWRDSQENLNKWLGNDGTEQLAKFDVFDTTMRQYYINAFNTALQSPNPNINLVMPEDMLNE